MWAVLHIIAEERIQTAMRNGEFDRLPGRGRPLDLEDDSMVPPELRMAYKLLKNGGYTPQEIEDDKEIKSIEEMLEHCEDEAERYRQIKKLNMLISRRNRNPERSLRLAEDSPYYQKVTERLSVPSKNKA